MKKAVTLHFLLILFFLMWFGIGQKNISEMISGPIQEVGKTGAIFLLELTINFHLIKWIKIKKIKMVLIAIYFLISLFLFSVGGDLLSGYEQAAGLIGMIVCAFTYVRNEEEKERA